MTIDITNREELHDWMAAWRQKGFDVFTAIKGPAPAGLTYEDGDPVTGLVNHAWRCEGTGDVFHLTWGPVERLGDVCTKLS